MFIFWSQSVRHHLQRWSFAILCASGMICFALCWVFLEVSPNKTSADAGTLSFGGKPLSTFALEAMREGVLPSPPHLAWEVSPMLRDVRFFWYGFVGDACWWMTLLWGAYAGAWLSALWLHRDTASWLFSTPISRHQWSFAVLLSVVFVGECWALFFLLVGVLFCFVLTGVLYLAPLAALVPLGVALALLASLALLLASLAQRAPHNLAIFFVLLFLLVCGSLVFTPSFFHRVIEPLGSARISLVYRIFWWLWPPFGSLTHLAKANLFQSFSVSALLFPTFYWIATCILTRFLLERRSL